MGLGNNDDQILPQKIEDLSGIEIKTASSGAYVTAVITSQGDLLMCGNPINGLMTDSERKRLKNSSDKIFKDSNEEMVVDNKNKEQHSFVEILFFREHLVQDISIGENVICCKTEKKIFYWGKLGMNLIERPIEAKELDSQNIIKISCGSSFIVCLSNSGDVFSWGNNDARELGHGAIGVHVPQPTKIIFSNNEKIKMIDIFSSYSSVVALQEGSDFENNIVWGKKKIFLFLFF